MQNEKIVFLLQPIDLNNQIFPILILSNNEDSARMFADKVAAANLASTKLAKGDASSVNREIPVIYLNKKEINCSALVEGKDYKIIKKFGGTLHINLSSNNKTYVVTLDKPVKL